MEARGANLIGGSLNGGTANLQQQLVFPPVPGLGRAETASRVSSSPRRPVIPVAASTGCPG